MDDLISTLRAIGFKPMVFDYQEGMSVSYTKETAQALLDRISELEDAITDAQTSAEEYIAALDEEDLDEDELGMALQSLEDALDNMEMVGVQLGESWKEGSK